MALVVADDRLLAAPDQRDGAAQLPRGEREQVLDREVLAPAERAADGGVAHDHLLFGQLEHRGELAAVLVQPLPRRLDDHALLLVHPGDASLGLEEGVLLPGGLELAFEDDVGLGEAARDVALADGDVQQQVRAALFVDQRRVGGQRGARIGHDGQVLVLDLDQLRAGLGGLLRLGDDERDLVAAEAHDLAAEDRLVGVDQAEGVIRNVAAVRTATTPGCASAAAVSSERMRAWGRSAKTTLRRSMSGRTRSAG